MAAASETCDNMVTDLGRDHLKNLSLNIEYTRTGMQFRFLGRNHARTEPTYSVQFNPAVYGFSEFSFAGFISSGPQRSARIDFHMGRMLEIDNIARANVELYCNNTLVGSTGTTYFPNPTHVDACKRDGGDVINGECHFNSSCVRRDIASTCMHYASLGGYTTCFNLEPKIHPDCKKAFDAGASKHADFGPYLASCPLINAQEAPFRTAMVTREKVELLYRDFRGRNPDNEGLAFWTNAIDTGATQLHELESILLTQP